MTEINPRHFIEELRFDIESRDALKARLVMAHFREMDAATQRMALFELYRGPDDFVLPLLVGLLAADGNGAESRPAIRELLFSKALDNPEMVTRLLVREIQPAHCEVLAEIAGEIKLAAATPTLLGILNGADDERVLRSAILALGMIGDPSATTPVSEFLYAGSAELVIAAIHALALLRTPTAIQRLAQKLGADPDLDAMILDAFTASQEPEALERLNALLSAQQAQLRNAAKQRLTNIGSKAVPVLIGNLRFDDPDLLIHTLNVLGDIGDVTAIAAIRKLLHNEPRDANVRFAAYEALGRLPMAKGAFALAQGLTDPVENVRCAAAGAIDHNYNTVLAAGIKNMLRDEDPVDRPISRTIMDTHCDTIFLDVIQEEHFRDTAMTYLGHQAHEDTRDHFVQLLAANGMAEFAAAIRGRINAPAPESLKVFAVDDSRMVLNIYRSILHNLGCTPVVFEFPAEAIARLETEIPDLIFTDLNMPEINGIDLTRAVRRRHPKERLPIIMVTTQNECQDNEAAHRAGVNAILNKPFNASMLQTAMETHLGRSFQQRAV
ncbi:response regulator [Desulfatitalea alkaliphila]|uniref:Response regulator n=1 Tax=Desulfatitalea alkaliphila TaxID=2929485 RepID=A0AA41UK43_9BACT|nr:response regulator [Desulfatitalea alkaliphila]MCJ8501914.1 response regulator [Desulfatitalea alkaliphila]